MQSGLGDIFDRKCSNNTKAFSNLSDYFCLFDKDTPSFEPGSSTSYSNAGYIILGRVVEVVSGQNFYNYIHQKIFKPIGMKNTAYDNVSKIKSGMAVGYIYKKVKNTVSNRTKNEKELEFEPNRATGKGTSAGGGYSTVSDFSKLDKALRNGKIISKTSLGKIFGEGFIKGQRNTGISGGAPGVTTRYRLRVDGLSIIALGNTDRVSAPNLVKLIENYLDE